MNPFRYSEPVPAAELIDRDAEIARLVATAVSGNNSRLLAPRRYGKTSLLNRLGEALAKEGWNAVYVDFFGVLTLADVSARVERAYATQLEGKVAAWFAGFRRRLRPSLADRRRRRPQRRRRAGPRPGRGAAAARAVGDPEADVRADRDADPRRLRRVPGRPHRLRPGRRRDPQRDPASRRRRQLRLRRLAARDDAEPVRRQAAGAVRAGARRRPLTARPRGRRHLPRPPLSGQQPRDRRGARPAPRPRPGPPPADHAARSPALGTDGTRHPGRRGAMARAPPIGR